MKPIEPGCLCLAFDPELVQPQECRAVEFFKKGTKTDLGKAKTDHWRVDRVLIYKKYHDDPCARPKYLIRIDGGEDLESRESKREVVS